MKYKYFSGCETVEAVKSRFRDLARKHHPDLGGDTATMQEINAEYERAMQSAINSDFASFSDEYRERAHSSIEPLREAIEFAVTLPEDITVTIRGFWLWLEGNTYFNKERIKSFRSTGGKKFDFAPKKKCWYFAAVPSSNRGREFSFEEIEALYGREEVSAPRRSVSALPQEARI